ncbi:MAG: flavodoxin domain-containing protein [Xanthomonadales bacterium]|nr:flavodoxin domain-containing protein [Xanthomonadales bacterium]
MTGNAAIATTPLPEPHFDRLSELATALSSAQLHWASGYLYGRAESVLNLPSSVTEAASAETLTIAYGSQTGNSRRLAEALAAQSEAAGLAVRLVSLADLRARELPSLSLFYAVISTQGDGDPPDDARRFLDELGGRRAPKLDGLRFAVLALGDSSYPLFCATGRALDERLAELGGRRVVDRADADLDFERDAAPWLTDALDTAKRELDTTAASTAATGTTPRLHLVSSATATPVLSAPNEAEVIVRHPLTTERAVRGVHHVELDIAGSGIAYQPGDALAVHVSNPEPLVEAVLDAAGLDGDTDVIIDDHQASLRDWLRNRRELTRLSLKFLRQHADRDDSQSALSAALRDSDPQAIRRWFGSRQLVDALREAPADWSAESLVKALPPLGSRAYSIASSRAEVGDDEVHLCVAEFDGEHDGRRWQGLASGQLSRLDEGASLRVSLEANPRFRLPDDDSTDILMIGAGSGVAPYRGFLQQRFATGGNGRNWLLFGNRHAREDFLYQAEWLDALRRGSLHRIDVAFSRDGDAVRYVQDRLLAEGRDVFDWIESGGRLYVCGDASRMAPDVDAALRRILETHAGIDEEGARERLNDLAAEGRYLRDVY